MSRTIGIAVAADRIATATWSRPLTPRALGAGEWDDLRTALVELRESLALRAPRAAIALLPPLAQARLLELPPLRPAEYRRILSRDAARYFPTGDVAQVAAGEPLAARGPRRSLPRVLAAVAASDLIEALVRTVDAAGWQLGSIVPAEVAWLQRLRGEVAALVVPAGTLVAVLRVAGGVPVALRRVRRPLHEAPRVVREVIAELERDGAAVQVLDDALSAAAAGAVRAPGPELLPDRVVVERRRRVNRRVIQLSAAALALLLAAAGLDLWGARRELAAVASRRAAIREEVAAALARQDTLESLVARHAALERAGGAAVRWSEVLTDFSDYLPRDAHLSAFRGRADSVGLEGIARRAAGVFEALRRAPRVAGVRADAPIRQETSQSGGPPVERFAVAARLASDAATRHEEPKR